MFQVPLKTNNKLQNNINPIVWLHEDVDDVLSRVGVVVYTLNQLLGVAILERVVEHRHDNVLQNLTWGGAS